MTQTLEQKITAFKELGQALPEIPESIKSNLNSTFELRPYHEELKNRNLMKVLKLLLNKTPLGAFVRTGGKRGYGGCF